jgi:hypothetical protein
MSVLATMIQASCHCGAVLMDIDTPPETVTECSCSNCRKRGALWAYYSPKQVRLIALEGATSVYTWNAREIEFHTCRTCGCPTHWRATDESLDRMAVNARLMEPDVLAAARIRRTAGP